MPKMTQSQRNRLGEVSRRRYFDVVCGIMQPDGTMIREVRTASTGRVKDRAMVTRRGRVEALEIA